MIVFHGRTACKLAEPATGRLVHWVDSDLPHIQDEAPDCQYAIPELEQNDVRSPNAYNAAALPLPGSMPEFAEIRSLGISEGRFYNSTTSGIPPRRVPWLRCQKAIVRKPPSVDQFVYLNDIRSP